MNVVATGRAKLVSISNSKTKPKDQSPVLPELQDLGTLRSLLDQTELGVVLEMEERDEGQAELMEGAAESARRRRSGVEGVRGRGGGGTKERWTFADWMRRK